MTLEQATQSLLAAIESEDLRAIAGALEVRNQAIRRQLESGEAPSIEAVQRGEQARAALAELKQKWARHGARLSQLQSGFTRPPNQRTPVHNFVG